MMSHQIITHHKPQKHYKTIICENSDWDVEFVNSRNPRYVYVIGCKFFIDLPQVDGMIESFYSPTFVSMHADFVHEYKDYDSFVCFTNELLPKRKKYPQLTNHPSLRIWFKNHEKKTLVQRSEDVKNSDQVFMGNYHFVLQLLIQF